MNIRYNQIGGNNIFEQSFTQDTLQDNNLSIDDINTQRRNYLRNFQATKIITIRKKMINDFSYAEKISKRFANVAIKNKELGTKIHTKKKYKSTFRSAFKKNK